MTTPFNINIPTSGQTLSETHSPIQGNFVQLNTQFSQNHVALTAAIDNGKHTKIEFNTNNGAGTPAGTQSEIYTSGASPQAYFHNANLTAQLSCILAWCRFDGSLATPIAITSGFNVTNITKVSAVVYTINFTNPLPNNNYGVLITGGRNAAAFSSSVYTTTPQTVNNVTIVMEIGNVPYITLLILGG